MSTETIAEKTPTANGILTDAGEITALAAELNHRSAERLAIKPPCPMAQSVANFAVKIASHFHKIDKQICEDHNTIKDMQYDIAVIKRCAKWTLGILVASIGSGGLFQVGKWIIAAIKHLPLILLAVALAGCGRPEIKPPAVTGQEITAEPTTLVDARLALVEASARLAASKEKVKALEKSQGQARVEAHRRFLAWATWACIAGMLACVFLAIFLPVMRKRMAMAAIGCAATIVVAQAIGVALPWLPLVGAGMAVVVLAGGLWVAIRALSDSTGLADRLKRMLSLDQSLTTELDTTRAEQTRRGTRRLIKAAMKAADPKRP
jgi:hypothetical protein